MELDELSNRLQALEDARQQELYDQRLAAFMQDNGRLFSNNAGLGSVIYDEVVNRIGPDAAVDAIKQTASDIVTQLSEEVDMLQNLLKATTRSTEDAIDQIKDQAEELSKTLDTINKDTPQPEAAPAPVEQPPVDMPPAEGTFGDMPMEAPVEQPPVDTSPAEGTFGDMPMEAPVEQPPVDMPPANVAPAMALSDERVKSIKAILSNRKPKASKPATMKLNSAFISACGGN